MRVRRGHDLTFTAVALRDPPAPDGEGGEGGEGALAYSAAKDGSVMMWDAKEGRKLHTLERRLEPRARGEGTKDSTAS